MGMYISDDAHESVRGIKFSGGLATAIIECGFDADSGELRLSRADVADVMSALVRNLEKGRTLVGSDGVVHAQSLRKLAKDADCADRLIEWLALSDDAELTFA